MKPPTLVMKAWSPWLWGGELQSPVVSICVFIFKEPQVSGGENGALFSESSKDGTHWQPG